MKKQIVSTMLIASSLFAGDLITFTSGTPAKASEVNANFSELASRDKWEIHNTDNIQFSDGMVLVLRKDDTATGNRANVTVQNETTGQYIQMEVRGSNETGTLFGLPYANTAYLRVASPNSTKLENFILGSSDADIIFAPGGTASVKVDTQGYIQLATTAGNTPSTTDCDENTEYGRMKVDEVNSLLYICTQSGWVSK
jgi:hypothetical protein